MGLSNDKRPITKMYKDNNTAIWWSKEDMTYARTKLYDDQKELV